jgi:dUTP pyrophosphatase
MDSIYIVNKSGLSKQFQKAHIHDAGFDLLSNVDTTIPARGSQLINTGLHVEVPYGSAGIIKSRSGLAVLYGLEVGAGVIDAGYTGEILILIRNHSDKDYSVRRGDKIAQMLIVHVNCSAVIPVRELTESERGPNGFNSTGH